MTTVGTKDFYCKCLLNPWIIGDIYLTHDSPSVRKSHNEGWKHQSAVRNYYSQFEENHTQTLIDQKIKLYEQKVQGGK